MSLIESTLAGAIGAVIATSIVFSVGLIRDWLAERKDVKYIRKILIDGRKPIMNTKDTYHSGMKTTLSAGALRAANYNRMLKQLNVALKKWTVSLSHDRRKDIFDALDWYNIDSLPVVSQNGNPLFVELPDGKWVVKEMTIEQARDKFNKLEAIEWLKLGPYEPGPEHNAKGA